MFLSVTKIVVAAVTETWFNDDIEEELISIDGYVISCKDRQQGRGGGVCIYLSEHLHLKRRTDLECLDMECMWLWLCPTRLPSPLTELWSVWFIVPLIGASKKGNVCVAT